MSVPAVPLRSRRPRVMDPAALRALRRARLTVVPRRLEQAARVPFLALVSLMLVGGVVTLLMFNTSMQQASFAATALEDKASTLTAREQTLKMELEQLRNPQRIAEEAQRMHMVIPSSPAFLKLADGSVVAAAAAAPATGLRLQGPPARRPAILDPKPVVVQGRPAEAGWAGRGDRQGDRRGDRRGDTDRRSPGSPDRDGRNGGGDRTPRR